jgi:hypothetical protein
VNTTHVNTFRMEAAKVVSNLKFSSLNFSGGNLGAGSTNIVLSGAGGSGNGTFRILTSTNVALPLASWAVATNSAFDLNGNFNVTNVIVPGQPQSFYLISVP